MEKEKYFSNLIKISFCILLLQCFYLQIIRFPYYSRRSKNNCIRTIETGIPRGKIFDRSGRVLAQDIPCFNLVFVPYDLKDPKKEAEILGKFFPAEKNKFLKILTKSYSNPFDRIILKKKISKEEASVIEENSLDLPGIFTQIGIDREYPLKKDACHVIGHTGEVSQIQIEMFKENGFKPGDVIGQYGLEKQYDEFIKGIPGGLQVEVDALGHHRKILSEKKMKPGNNLVLTIDQTYQEICSKHLGERKGCVIMMDPRNGQILSLVSKPGFDPDEIEQYLGDRNNPFLNRAIQGQYPPGSIFKIITEIAGLETGAIEEHDRIECTGEIQIADTLFHCWIFDKEGKGHGWIDINQALPFSCNIFFGTVGMRIGTAKLIEYAKMFGLGETTGIDLPGEKKGYLPSPTAPHFETGGPLNLAIGQGALTTTPIQLLSLISTVANGGNIWKPYIVKKIISPDGNIIKEFQPTIKNTVYISSETMEILKKGLKNVVLYGTGTSAKIDEVDVSGKTGTAQLGGPELELPTHGGFVCYAPSDNPTISLVVFLDTGSSFEAATIAGKILKDIFSPTIQEDLIKMDSDIYYNEE